MVVNMVSRVLSSNLREKAGSNAFNRFEYQVYWIVYHIITEFVGNKNNNNLVVCEFHDDMAKFNSCNDPEYVEFFRIKTTEVYTEWSLSKLSKRIKRKNGTLKNSFLGFIYYNFMKFMDECTKCHFVSNKKMNEDIRKWQSIIEDGKILHDEDKELYDNIYNIIKTEFSDMPEDEFKISFEKFIQNTYIYYTDITLENYERVVSGAFFDMLSEEDIYTSSSNKILKNLIEEVRKKSKEPIDTSISFSKIKEKKGIRISILKDIKEFINDKGTKMKIDKIKQYLTTLNVNLAKQNLIINKLIEHRNVMLDISNHYYHDNHYILAMIIDDVIINSYNELDNICLLLEKIKKVPDIRTVDSSFYSDLFLEVLLYERLFK
jgi:hypothetical protein